MQLLLGDRVFLDAASGRNAYLGAALRSLPMHERPGAGTAADAQEQALAAALLQHVAPQAAGAPCHPTRMFAASRGALALGMQGAPATACACPAQTRRGS
jgi:hypothetical protein